MRAPESELPYDFEAERSVLGAVFLNNEAYFEAAGCGLKVVDFHLDSHRRIYIAMTDLSESQVPIDMITIIHYLEGQGDLEAIGGAAYISSLVQGVPDRPSIRHYIDILKDKSLRRQILYMGNRLAMMAVDPSDPIRFTMSGAHDELLRLQGDAQEKSLVPLAEITETVLKNIESMMSYAPDQTIGVPFGIPELDESTTGMREGQFVVLGGFPKSGKTSFAIDVVRKAGKEGRKVGFFSLEMLKEELTERMLAQESDVSYLKIRKPMHLPIAEFRVLQRMKLEMDKWPIMIDDTARHISEIIPRAHLMIRQKGVELIVVDYLQIVDATGEKEYERVSQVANSLTALAKTTKVPVLALSQLTHPEGRKGDLNLVPNMGMLRSSGQIAQNAHLIMFCYHPVETESGQPTGEDLIVVGAQRAGPTGRIKVFFNVQQQRWEPRGAPAPAVQQEAMF